VQAKAAYARQGPGIRQLLSHPKPSQKVVNEMGEENHQQQTPDATNPEQKMFGQFWGVDLFFVHD
jgi:hypothetical protein